MKQKYTLADRIILENICNAIVMGMDQGFSLDGALRHYNIDKQKYLKFAKHNKVINAVRNGESKRKGYWEDHIKASINKPSKVFNPALLIRMYESCITKEDESDVMIPKIQVIGLGSLEQSSDDKDSKKTKKK